MADGPAHIGFDDRFTVITPTRSPGKVVRASLSLLIVNSTFCNRYRDDL